ncbi:MAG: aspartate-semialdehyde dehydrogenase [Candidatus Aureabacteria bacterium]|jgi:aspartate-semialdehyde dehydrogenase|nr:aspartate-semialdehyde dehydrogenase [Candidatus Auribacterota bacterium]NLW93827.1 aspartate-semialdehyde dehydrogenase [Chlamydiota bacterium]HOE26502.1 aspartate-semialdehyde dehydrogenase [bacterium]HQM53321.1 aspartate-semialdehyde dehydrogenase [bacterium]
MARRYTVAIAGATGVVGTEMLRTLAARNFPVGKLRLLASARSAGKRLRFAGEDIPVEELTADSFAGVEIALFSAGAARSKEFAPAAVKAGAVVVDNSSAFRMDPDVPLVVPEVNPEKVREHKGIVANPNCSTSILAVPLWPLHRAARIVRIVAATYQAASGAGAGAMAELRRQVREIEEGREANVSVLPQQIAFNLFPHVDVFLPNGYTKEEMKLVHETRKIFGDETIRVTATCVRVPILRAHSEAVNIETERKLSAEEARRILAKAPGVCVVDEPERKRYPMPLTASGRDEVLVGRIREDISQPNGLDLFIAGDQLLKGAALNAVQIAELLIKNG